MYRKSVLFTVSLVLFWIFAVTSTSAEVIHFSDFEGTVGSEWSSGMVSTTPLGNRRFLGEFGRETVSLTLDGLPFHEEATIIFDLLILKSWDGYGENGFGPDIWKL